MPRYFTTRYLTCVTFGDSITLVTSSGGVGAELVEEPHSVSEQERSDVDLQLVEQPGLQALLNDVRTSGHRTFLSPAAARACVERGVEPVGDERERRPALLRQRLAGVVGEDEDRDAERRVVAPPAVRDRDRPPTRPRRR